MFAVPVHDPTQVAQARRRVGALAAAAGLGEARAADLALVVTELATNLVKHAEGGQIVATATDAGIDVLALDRGPGMADIGACTADGYSTSGTPGHGLGAVSRLADDVHMLSWPGIGSALLARIGRGAARDDDVGALVLPLPGEEASGDAWSLQRDADGLTLLVVDGLGHGAEAARAAHAAVTQFQRSRGEAPARVVEALHHALRPTRGAAVAVARVERASATVSFAGVGNIAAALVGAGSARRLVSHNGTAGHNARRIQAFDYPCGDGLLVMHSDGLGTHWSLDRYPGLEAAPPLLVAGVLYQYHARGRDDVAVVVARTARP